MDTCNWTDIENGNKEAYAEVYLFYFQRLYNYGRKFTAECTLIEDAIQEVFIMLWTNRSTLSAIQSPQSYIFRSFRNGLLKKVKAAHQLILSDAIIEDLEFESQAITLSEGHISNETQLKAMIANLTPRQREAIFLRFFEGLSYQEVSEAMGISTKATYKIMARALLELKEALQVSMICLLATLHAGHLSGLRLP